MAFSDVMKSVGTLSNLPDPLALLSNKITQLPYLLLTE
jgi:hypothetical protein